MPLGTRHATGVVWASARRAATISNPSRPCATGLPLQKPLRDFIDWVARWTLSPRGMVLRMAIRAHEVLEPPAQKFSLVATGKPPARMTEARGRVLAALAGATAPIPKSSLAELAGCSVSVIDGLVEDGALALVELAAGADRQPASTRTFGRPCSTPTRSLPPTTSPRAVAARAFSATLLEGVTGSGKTEVYFEAIAEALRQGRQALVLLPEIALTAQFLDRFAARFGARPAEWHSGLTERQRERTWSAVASGEARAVVGARSALFLPFADLGLIVVDEEHEGAYKQEDGVVYNARDMGVVRARLEQAPVVLASATPAIETRVNAETGRYGWLTLPSRFGAADAAGHRDRRPEARGTAARTLAVASGDRRDRGALLPRASRRCCSSTGAAMRRSPSAAPAATASNAPIAPRGWSSTASARRSSAIIAGTSSRAQSSARNATTSTA